jgi:hypothetical protein
MPFEPGQSGNPAGTSKSKPFFAALDRAIKQDDAKRLRDSAEKLLDLAAAGEPFALQMLADRLDGKVPQALHHGGSDGGQISITVSQTDTGL